MTRAVGLRARSGRALLASAVLAATLALGGCYGEDGYQLPSRAMKQLSPEMVALLQKKNMPEDSPILIRIFKEESELEVWKQDTTGHYALLKVYPICRWSGQLGPKVKEGDRQAPEGFYPITPGLMNPNSSYYLAINTGFPNAYDRANNRHGAFLMIHGDCSSRGCYAMTDEEIGEIYALARDAFLGGQKAFQIQAYPFRMTPANLARHRNNPNMPFWRMIKQGYDHFEVSHLEPKVDVCERHYVFDAVPPPNSTRRLVFNPTGPCPKYQIDPAIAEAVKEKQQHDDAVYAQLVRENVPEAPLDTGTDGGMNRVFVAKLDNQTYWYDNNGHVHVPPLQPGRLPPAISPPRGSESETRAAIAEPPGQTAALGSTFGGLFSSSAAAAPAGPDATGSAAGAGQSHGAGFFGSLFASRRPEPPSAGAAAADAAKPAPTARASAKDRHRPVTTASLRLRTESGSHAKSEPHKREPQAAGASGGQTPNTGAGQQANAASPATGGLISGAQPVLPSGSFDSRWGGLQ